MKYAIYARVSTSLEAQDSSFEAQTQDLHKRVEILYPELELYKVYSDHGISGTKLERPDFQQMIADAIDGQFEVIVTKSISRFARNTKILLNTLDELNKAGVKVIFLEENIDTSQASQKFLLTVLGALAEMESVNTKEHRREAKKIRWASDKIACPNHLPFGYKFEDNKIIINEEEAKTVRFIFNQYLQCKSSLQIVRMLEAKGVPTKHGRPWQMQTVRTMLKNKKYIGVFEEKDPDTGEVHTFECPAIISQEDFDKVQKSFKQGKQGRRLYPLSNKVYNEAGLKVTRTTKVGKPYFLDEPSSGIPMWGYLLNGHGDYKTKWLLSETSLYLVIIHALVDHTKNLGKLHRGTFWEEFINQLQDPEEIEYNKELAAYEAKKSSLIKQKTKLIELFKKDIIDLEEVTRDTKRIDKQLRELAMPIPPETKTINTIHITNFIEAVSQDDVESSVNALTELFKDPEQRKSICDTFIKRIDLLERKHVKITLNDDTELHYFVKRFTPKRPK